MSYGSKMPPPPPATSSLRAAGFLVSVAFFVSALFMVAIMQHVGVGDGPASELLSSPRGALTLRLAAAKPDADAVPLQILQQLNLQLSADAEDVRVSLAFNGGDPVVSGDFVPMKEAQEAPSVSIEGTSSSTAELYTYVLVDIDAPDPKAPTHAPFLHYILADLTVDDQEQQHEVVVPYYPVTPPVGEHRYLSLLFRQQEDDFDGPDDALTAERSNFDVARFATQHKLQLVTTASFHSHPASQDA